MPSLSSGTIIIVAPFALTAFVSSLASVRHPFLRQTAVGSLLVLVSALALILPYLVLSRSFDYYWPNFMPFIVFSMGPAVAALRTTRGRSLPISRAISVAVAALLGLLVLAVMFMVSAWTRTNAEMSVHGWVALSLGVFFSLLIGCGLMALVFYSSRRGYDDRAH